MQEIDQFNSDKLRCLASLHSLEIISLKTRENYRAIERQGLVRIYYLDLIRLY